MESLAIFLLVVKVIGSEKYMPIWPALRVTIGECNRRGRHLILTEPGFRSYQCLPLSCEVETSDQLEHHHRVGRLLDLHPLSQFQRHHHRHCAVDPDRAFVA